VCRQCRQCSRSTHCLTCSDLLLSLCALGPILKDELQQQQRWQWNPHPSRPLPSSPAVTAAGGEGRRLVGSSTAHGSSGSSGSSGSGHPLKLTQLMRMHSCVDLRSTTEDSLTTPDARQTGAAAARRASYASYVVSPTVYSSGWQGVGIPHGFTNSWTGVGVVHSTASWIVGE
jgi:hypothetical protein